MNISDKFVVIVVR